MTQGRITAQIGFTKSWSFFCTCGPLISFCRGNISPRNNICTFKKVVNYIIIVFCTVYVLVYRNTKSIKASFAKKKDLKQAKRIFENSLTNIIKIFKNTQTVHLGNIIWCEPLITICKLIQFIYLSTQPFIQQTAVEFYYMPKNKLYSLGDEYECNEYKCYGSYPKAIYSWATFSNFLSSCHLLYEMRIIIWTSFIGTKSIVKHSARHIISAWSKLHI